MMNDKNKKKPIMRALGESVGILWNSIKQPAQDKDKPRRQVVDREVKETRQGNLTLRETTIREIEFNNKEQDGQDDDENRNVQEPPDECASEERPTEEPDEARHQADRHKPDQREP